MIGYPLNTAFSPVARHPNLFASKEEYIAFVTRWKALARAKALSAEDCLLRCLLLGQDPARALPVTPNERKLAAGAALNSGLFHAARSLRAVGDPVANSAARAARVADYDARGRGPAPEYLTQRPWHANWVDVADPASTGNGLSVARLAAACQLANQAGA